MNDLSQSQFAPQKYAAELRLLEAVAPFVSEKTQHTIKTLSEFYRYKAIFEAVSHKSTKQNLLPSESEEG